MRKALLVVTGLLTALLASGCSFNWGEGGISDVLFGGRKAGDIVKEGEQPNELHASQNAPNPNQPPAEEQVEGSSLRKIAILPVAWTDGTNGQPCDLCPASVVMKPTDLLSSRLATGFIYEQVATHPRFLFPPHSVIEKTMEQAPDRSMKAAAAALAASNRADYVIVAALVELRQRVGDDDKPEQPAGVEMYAALIDTHTFATLWSDTFNENESSRGMVLGTYDKVMNDKPIRWHTAQEFSEHAVDTLIEDLVDELD